MTSTIFFYPTETRIKKWTRPFETFKINKLSWVPFRGFTPGAHGGGTHCRADRFSLQCCTGPTPAKRSIYPRTRDSCNNSESVHSVTASFISSNPIFIHCDSLGALRSKKIAGLAMRFTGASLTYTADVWFLLLALLLEHTYLLSEPFRKKLKLFP